MTPLPVLLPAKCLPPAERSPLEWVPKADLSTPAPAPVDETTVDQEIAMARQAMEGKVVRKVRPRRTVDYGGPMGRWTLVSVRLCPSDCSAYPVCYLAVAEDATKPKIHTLSSACTAIYHQCTKETLDVCMS